MTWQPTKTTADYTPAVMVYPDGRTQPCNVKAVRLDGVEAACEKLGRGRLVFVARDDVDAVREWTKARAGKRGAMD